MAYPPPYSNPPFPGGAPPPGPPGGYAPPGGYGPPGGPPGYGPPAGGYGPGGTYQPYMPPPGPYAPGPMPPQDPIHGPGGGCPPPIGPGPNWQMPPPPEQNPAVPLHRALPLPAQDGLMVVLMCYVPPGANRFDINLCCGGEADGKVPIALHVNPRFEGTNQVVRNSFAGGAWGNEEREGGFPVAHGRDFEVIILFTPDCFKVAFNGSHYCDFRYRMRKEDVTHLSVQGDVAIRCLRFQPPSQPPPMNPPYMPGPPMIPPAFNPPRPAMPPVVTYQMSVPHEQKIHGSFLEGRKIHVSGRMIGTRFSINLCYHNNHKRDIAFHFNPRLDDKVVVQNTMAGYTWGKEERRQPSMPFAKGTHFDVVITCQKDKFVVHVNNQHFTDYSHRLRNLKFIQLLYISGGVELSSVVVQ